MRYLFYALAGALLGTLLMQVLAHSAEGTSTSGIVLSAKINEGCVLATIGPEDKVTINWDCVDKGIRREVGAYNREFALIIKAARESRRELK